MSAKIFEVSPDGTNWAVMPGNDASVDLEGEDLDTTVFGSDFSSSITGIINHSFSGNAMFRETAGYNGRIRKEGDAVAFTDEATTANGDWYEITDRTKSLFDYNTEVVVEDDATPVADADIEEIDYLHGRVKFVDAYTVTGPITLSGDYKPLSTFGCFNSLDLTQSSETIETGCFETVGANGGYQTYKPTLRDVSIDAEGFYQTSSDFASQLQNRERFIIEIDIEGDGENLARGYFRIGTDGYSGGPGGDETESVSFSLFVPEGVKPFSWRFGANTKAPQGLIWTIEAWENKTNLHYRYFPEGRDNKGFEAESVVTDCSISTAVDALAEASVSGQGTGAFTILNDTP
jgi:hypothetical protein